MSKSIRTVNRPQIPSKEWYERRADLEEGLDVSAGCPEATRRVVESAEAREIQERSGSNMGTGQRPVGAAPH